MLMGDRTVTLVRCDSGAYVCTVIGGASVYGRNGISSASSGDTPGSRYVVRLPDCGDELLPMPGDYIALGSIDGLDSVKELAGYTYFRVTQVFDNRRGRLRHIRVVGE